MKRGALFACALWLTSVASATTWTNIGPFGGEAHSLASDASGVTRYVLNRRSGVFRSSGGGPWNLVFDAVARGVTPTRVAVDPQTSRVYVGTTRGLYRSDDGGLSWQALPTDPIIDVTAAGDRVIISVPTGLQRSGDAGATRINIDSPLGDPQTIVSLLRMDSPVIEHVLAIAAGNLFLSSDLGRTWLQLKNAKNVVAAVFGDVIYAGGSNGVYACEADCQLIGTDPVVDVAYWRGSPYAAIIDGVLRYQQSWQRLVEGFPNAMTRSLLATPSELLAGTTAGVYGTEDGARWRNRGEGLTNVRISGIANAGGSLFAATLGQGIMRRDGTWVDVSSGLPSNPPIAPAVRVLASDGSTLYAGFLGSGLLRSTNLGASWENVSAGLSSRDVLDVAADSGIVVVAAGAGLLRSADRGATWQTFKTYPALLASIVAVKGTIVAAASATNVFVSMDSGATWQAKELPGTIRRLAIAGTRIVAASDQGIFVRTDGGWIGPAFATSGVNAITAAGIRAYASLTAPSGSGIYFTDDGLTWFLVPGSDGLPADITVLASDVAFLYAGTNGGSIFAAPLSTRRHAVSR